jgi:hypothetical protein
MNFQSFGVMIGMKMAIVTVLGGGLSAIASMPAQASSIAGKTFAFHGSASLLSETDATTVLDFLPSYYAPTNDGQASVAFSSEIGAYQQQFMLKDIPLVKTLTGWSLTGGNLAWITDPGLVTYTLTAFNLSKTVTGFEAMIDGIFSPENLGTVDGYFSSQKKLATIKGTSFSADFMAMDKAIDQIAVPTPALLPGLIGLGATIVRKRRNHTIAA